MVMFKSRKVGVLLGGLSSERELSLRSGQAILRALRERNYDACPVFVDRDLDLVLRQTKIDVAFLALRGRYGEDGCVQGLLELMNIPYTGSGVLASGLAMNKARAKEIFRWHNLPTAPGYVIDASGSEAGWDDFRALPNEANVIAGHGAFGFPVVVKPVSEGSSVGVRLVEDELELESAVEDALRFDDQVLVERFVAGREISVGVLNGRPLGAIEIAPRRGIYDFENRHPVGRRLGADVHSPARLSPERYRSAVRLAVQAQAALGCEGAARVDLIVSERGNEVILEVNTLPGLNPNGSMARIAEGAGLSYGALVEEVLNSARLKTRGRRRESFLFTGEPLDSDERAGSPVTAH